MRTQWNLSTISVPPKVPSQCYAFLRYPVAYAKQRRTNPNATEAELIRRIKTVDPIGRAFRDNAKRLNTSATGCSIRKELCRVAQLEATRALFGDCSLAVPL